MTQTTQAPTIASLFDAWRAAHVRLAALVSESAGDDATLPAADAIRRIEQQALALPSGEDAADFFRKVVIAFDPPGPGSTDPADEVAREARRGLGLPADWQPGQA